MEQVKNFFRYNKSERIGAIIFLLILTGINLWVFFKPSPEKLDISYTILEKAISEENEKKSGFIDKDASTKKTQKSYKKSPSNKEKSHSYKKPTYESKWKNYPKEEFKKDTVYENVYESKYPKKKNEPIDINSATTEQWETLSGIGPVLSERIVKFRDGMGGFYKVEQVGETWGLPPETFEKIKPLLLIETPQKRVSINSITAEELADFRFISLKEAKVVIRYREQNGPFQSVKDLEKVVVLESDQIAKLEPYISFE